MLILVKRWITYLFIPAGFVLLFLPLNTHRTVDIEKDQVYLRISESLAAQPTSKTNAIPTAPENPTEEELLQYIQGLQKVVSREHSSVATTANSRGYPVIKRQDLTAYPALMEAVDDMMQLGLPWTPDRIQSSRLNDAMQLEEWAVFKTTFLSNTDSATFQYGDQIFTEHISSEYVSSQVEIKNLNLICKGVGTLFLLLGLFTWRQMYTPPPSEAIQIGKRSGMILWDIITISVAVLFTWALLDSLLVIFFQTSSVLGDVQMGLFMGVFWVTFANLVMTLFVTATGLQMLLINEKGVSVNGLFGRKALDWSGVEDIRLAEMYSVRRIGGFFAPRKLAKILEVRGKTSTLRIMEPPFSSTKKEILNTLNNHAPKELQGLILDLSPQWLSVW